ncbi:MAG TPA: FHA domain-containing protein [Burkholderiales bacterium]|nr:FHA domain-containing protein [Burkholderiales bacterium]
MFLELLDRAGEVRSRVRVSGLPFTIGRAYDNDLILDDPFVAPHHLRIERRDDGALELVDLGSRNGLYLVEPLQRVTRLALGADQRVRVGHTQLRLREANFPVEPEREDTMPWFSALDRPVFFLALLLAAGLLLWDAYVSAYDESATVQIVASVLAALLGTLAWAGVWAFIGRLATHHAGFYAHGAIALLGMTAIWVVYDLVGYLEFSLSLEDAQPFGLAAALGCLGAVIYGHLRLVSRLSARRAAATAGTVSGTLLGALLVVEFVASMAYSPDPDFSASLKAPLFRLSRGETLQQFVAGARALRVQVDAMRDQR